MGSEKVPDLRRLILGVMETIHFTRPEVVTQEHMNRVREASNVMLVATRVMVSICKDVELITAEDVARIVSSASKAEPMTAKEAMMASGNEVAKVTGRMDTWDVLQRIDDVMADPVTRVKVPEWFINDMWPGVLKKVAMGGSMEPREREIALYVASTARGER